MFTESTIGQLKSEFQHRLKVASGSSHVHAPSPALVAALEADFVASGGKLGTINWVALVPQLIGLAVQYGPEVWTIVQSFIAAFTGGAPIPAPVPAPPVVAPPPAPTGPVISAG